MQTSVSKLTRKYQATIPGRVREALGVKAGDSIAFDCDGKEVRVRKARALDLAFARAVEGTLQEWATEEDERSYREL